jgi:hypothetical protein
MATKIVTIEMTTKAQTFPLGTQEDLFHFQIARASDNFVLSFLDTAVPAVSFPGVPTGDYVASVTKNGVTVSKAFSIAKTEETFNVPDTITISIAS